MSLNESLLGYGIQTIGNMVAGGVQQSMNNSSARSAFERSKNENRYLLTHGPELQVQGIENAGLNPALLNGQASQLSAPSSPAGQTNVTPAVLDAQIGLLASQEKNLDAQAFESMTKGNQNSAETQKALLEAIRLMNLTPVERKKMEQEIMTSSAQESYYNSLTSTENATRSGKVSYNENLADYYLAQANYIDNETNQAIKLLPYRLKEAAANISVLNSQAKLNNAQAEKATKEIVAIGKQIEVYTSQADYNKKLVEELDKRIPLIKTENDIKELEKHLIDVYGNTEKVTGLVHNVCGSLGSILTGLGAVGIAVSKIFGPFKVLIPPTLQQNGPSSITGTNLPSQIEA